MKIYLDDERITPEGWVRCYTPQEVNDLFNQFEDEIEILSLDHDLGENADGDGNDVINYIEEQVFLYNRKPPKQIVVHSANPAGRKEMELGIESIYKIHSNNITKKG